MIGSRIVKQTANIALLLLREFTVIVVVLPFTNILCYHAMYSCIVHVCSISNRMRLHCHRRIRRPRRDRTPHLSWPCPIETPASRRARIIWKAGKQTTFILRSHTCFRGTLPTMSSHDRVPLKPLQKEHVLLGRREHRSTACTTRCDILRYGHKSAKP